MTGNSLVVIGALVNSKKQLYGVRIYDIGSKSIIDATVQSAEDRFNNMEDLFINIPKGKFSRRKIDIMIDNKLPLIELNNGNEEYRNRDMYTQFIIENIDMDFVKVVMLNGREANVRLEDVLIGQDMFFKYFYKFDKENNIITDIYGNKLPAKKTAEKLYNRASGSSRMSLLGGKVSFNICNDGKNVILNGFDKNCPPNIIEKTRKMVIPDGVTIINNGAFKGNKTIEAVMIPSSVKIIGAQAFEDCIALKKVKFSEGLNVLEKAFTGCSSLEKVELPRSLKIIKDDFERCIHIRKVYVSRMTRIDMLFPKKICVK